MNQPPRWGAEDLDKDSRQATEIFRKERLEEPLPDELLAHALAGVFDVDPHAFALARKAYPDLPVPRGRLGRVLHQVADYPLQTVTVRHHHHML